MAADIRAPPVPEEGKKSIDVASNEEIKASPATETEIEKEPEYPTGLPLTLIIVALCLAVFVVALDNTIIATAIPKITDQFNSLPDVGWYASAYLLPTGALQLLFGQFFSTFSIKWVFIASLTIFELGSVICAAAPSSVALIIGRAVAGVGGAGIFAGALLILANCVPLRARPTYMGAIGGMWGVASVAGPLLGGVFTDKVTWRLCFWINLPIGFVTIVFVAFLYHEPPRSKLSSIGWKKRLQIFDPTGNIFLIPSIVCLFLALQWGGTKYPWSNGRIIALLVVFGLLLIVFIVLQWLRPKSAMIPGRLIRQRSILAGCIFVALLSGPFFILSYYLPIWFQAVKGVSAIQSGIMNIPLILGCVVASMIAGAGTTVVGYYTPFMYVSVILMCIGCGFITTFTITTAAPAWIGFQVLAGLGLGLGMQVPFIATQTVLPTEDLPMGTAIIVFFQTVGGAVMVAVGQTTLTNELVGYLRRYTPELDPRVILGVGATRIHTVYDGAQLEGIKWAYNDALSRVFLVTVILGALAGIGAAGMEWRSVKKGGAAGEKKDEEAKAESGNGDVSGSKSAEGESAKEKKSLEGTVTDDTAVEETAVKDGKVEKIANAA